MRVRVTTRAAMFWHFCSLATVSSGRPASRALFSLSLYVMDRIRPVEIQLDFLCLGILNFTSCIGRCLSLACEINTLRVVRFSVGSACICVSSMSDIFALFNSV